MPFDRGEIVLVLFPNTDLRTAKRRPVLVVQASQLTTGLPQTVVAMISSNLNRANHPSRVALRKTDRGFPESGLLTNSVIMTDNLATVRESEIAGSIGRLTDLSDVNAALRHTLGL